MRVLITGGAGYIGSHVVRDLLSRGDQVLVIDDLSTGLASRIPSTDIRRLDLSDPAANDRVHAILEDFQPDGVIHFAAKKRVDESVADPEGYFLTNIGALAVLLKAMAKAKTSRLIFSSSAAVYRPDARPLVEDCPLVSSSPYGLTKLVGEQLVATSASSHGMKAISLRYFNVAGVGHPGLAEPDGFNLVPQMLRRIRAGLPPMIFGDDYPTADGTCVRDYVHVKDVSSAHIAALDATRTSHTEYSALNVGTGHGVSVREVADMVLAETGSHLRPTIEPRRPGDPAAVVADVERIQTEIGWRARHTLADIIQSAVALG